MIEARELSFVCTFTVEHEECDTPALLRAAADKIEHDYSDLATLISLTFENESDEGHDYRERLVVVLQDGTRELAKALA